MAEHLTPVTDSLLRRQDVERLTGLARSAIYSRLNASHPQHDPTFPRPVPMGGPADRPTCVRWSARELDTWIQARIAGRDTRKAA